MTEPRHPHRDDSARPGRASDGRRGRRPRAAQPRGGQPRRDGSRPSARATARPTARTVAFEVIRAVNDADAYANLLLPRAIERAGLGTADAGLATELTYGTLRRLGYYDGVIALAASRPTERIDPPVLDALRLGAHQLLATRVAAHAAVNESVALARTVSGQATAGFVNAVLRTISRERPERWLERVLETARSDDERLSLEHSHPVWVVRALRRSLAAEGRADELHELLAADNLAPRVTMIALPGLASVPEGAERTEFSPYGFRLGGGDPEAIVRAAKGRVRVQDEGSQLAALALTGATPVRPGERWLDLCAGPGGKTALLAADALRSGATLDANEVSPARAGLVRRAVAAVPMPVPVSEEDGRARRTTHPGSYDRVLVDAPCTGLGALRRRPEARWRKQPSDIPELSKLQQELFLAGFDSLAPGGVLAYVTCSPHLAETRSVVAEARRVLGDAIEPLDASEVLRRVCASEIDIVDSPGDGHVQLWPHRHGTDAMFISLFRRVDASAER
ncbi:MAG: transcription antitermination factor NusB [Microbacteriaceae bacterium]|nr:transcription antitermination factor NusB [Microbacteriaceae bacterium]HPZ35285.1 transcription antitermination factor NusB [Microbacteriaceae bacterium]HQC92599.1 transcription antitermination factor NusB [Microbacteriaceae bacterium]